MPQSSQIGRRANASVVSRVGSIVADITGADVAIEATFEEAQRSELPGASGGPQDAYRHVLISAELVRQFGPNIGAKLAQAHEIGNKLQGQGKADSKMDDHNNSLGRDIGTKAKTWEDVVRMAREKIAEAAEHGGDGKEGRALWHNKPEQPDWKPDWTNKPIAPNPKGGAEHRDESLRLRERKDGTPKAGSFKDRKEPGEPGDTRSAPGREPARPEPPGRRSETPGADRAARDAAAPEAAEKAMMARLLGGEETVDEIMRKPACRITRPEIDRVIASDAFMNRSDPDFAAINDLVTAWYRNAYGGLPVGADEIVAEARIARTPTPAPAPDGGMVADGAVRIGRELVGASGDGGLRRPVARLQVALNDLESDAPAIAVDSALDPLTAARLRRLVARRGAGTVLDAFRRVTGTFAEPRS